MADKTGGRTNRTMCQVLVNAHCQCVRSIYLGWYAYIQKHEPREHHQSKSAIETVEMVEKEDVAGAIRIIIGTGSLCSAMATQTRQISSTLPL